MNGCADRLGRFRSPVLQMTASAVPTVTAFLTRQLASQPHPSLPALLLLPPHTSACQAQLLVTIYFELFCKLAGPTMLS